ncbi:MAG: hypothetical protein E5W65_32130, partial [Mesorhizobium sp.]
VIPFARSAVVVMLLVDVVVTVAVPPSPPLPPVPPLISSRWKANPPLPPSPPLAFALMPLAEVPLVCNWAVFVISTTPPLAPLPPLPPSTSKKGGTMVGSTVEPPSPPLPPTALPTKALPTLDCGSLFV